LSAVGVVDGIG